MNRRKYQIAGNVVMLALFCSSLDPSEAFIESVRPNSTGEVYYVVLLAPPEQHERLEKSFPVSSAMPRTISEGDGDPRHGTMNGYHNLKCRCPECQRAWAAYYKEQRKKRSKREPLEHGNPNTYLNWACRCPECTEAHTARRREQSRRQHGQ